jgi:hypothetical protein
MDYRMQDKQACSRRGEKVTEGEEKEGKAKKWKGKKSFKMLPSRRD